MPIIVKGLKNLGTVYESRVKELRDSFNKNLVDLVQEWQKMSANTFVHKDGIQGFKNITQVQKLSRQSGGTRGTIKGKVILEVQATSLTDFSVEQQRISINNSLNRASIKKGKYSESKIGDFEDYADTWTKAKILKQKSLSLVQPRGKKGLLGAAEGRKGFMYSPTNRVTAKESTPLGVYIRLQKATWKGKQRLPIAKIYAPPLAIIMLSPRIMKRLKLEQRLSQL